MKFRTILIFIFSYKFCVSLCIEWHVSILQWHTSYCIYCTIFSLCTVYQKLSEWISFNSWNFSFKKLFKALIFANLKQLWTLYIERILFPWEITATMTPNTKYYYVNEIYPYWYPAIQIKFTPHRFHSIPNDRRKIYLFYYSNAVTIWICLNYFGLSETKIHWWIL